MAGIKQARFLAKLEEANLIERVERLEKIIGSGAMAVINGLHPLQPMPVPIVKKTVAEMRETYPTKGAGPEAPVAEPDDGADVPDDPEIDGADLAAVDSLAGPGAKMFHHGFGRWSLLVDDVKIWPAEDKWGTKPDAEAHLATL